MSIPILHPAPGLPPRRAFSVDETKARLYARHGIREYWVIDANERRTFVHTGPTADGWSSIVERGPDEALTTAALPGFALKLGDISL
jgi:Uma2 family endonuclease